MSILNELKSQAAALQSQQLIPLEDLGADADGFGVLTTTGPAARIHHSLMDKLAKLVVAQPSRFL